MCINTCMDAYMPGHGYGNQRTSGSSWFSHVCSGGRTRVFQAWWQVLLPTKQSHWPSPPVCVGINGLSENDQIIYRSWYPPEMEGITLLLNMPLVLVTGHKEIELELSWECSPCWLVFVLLEGSMQALGGEHVSVVSFCCELCLLYNMTGQALCAH